MGKCCREIVNVYFPFLLTTSLTIETEETADTWELDLLQAAGDNTLDAEKWRGDDKKEPQKSQM